MKKIKRPQVNRLALNRELIRIISTDQLEMVSGGDPDLQVDTRKIDSCAGIQKP